MPPISHIMSLTKSYRPNWSGATIYRTMWHIGSIASSWHSIAIMLKRILLLVTFGILLGLLAGVAVANGDYDDDDDSVVVSPSNSDTYVLGLGVGDVEIGQCLASKSTPVFQWLKENPWCMADTLDNLGRHSAAAQVRCETKTLRKVYASREACIRAVTVIPEEPSIPIILEAKEIDPEYEDRLIALEELFDKQQQVGQRSAQRQQVQQQQYEEIQQAEESRKRRIDLIREEFGKDEQAGSASH